NIRRKETASFLIQVIHLSTHQDTWKVVRRLNREIMEMNVWSPIIERERHQPDQGTVGSDILVLVSKENWLRQVCDHVLNAPGVGWPGIKEHGGPHSRAADLHIVINGDRRRESIDTFAKGYFDAT